MSRSMAICGNWLQSDSATIAPGSARTGGASHSIRSDLPISVFPQMDPVSATKGRQKYWKIKRSSFLLFTRWNGLSRNNLGSAAAKTSPKPNIAAIRQSVKKTSRVYLKTPNVTDSEEFSRCARHFFAGILTYFKEK